MTLKFRNTSTYSTSTIFLFLFFNPLSSLISVSHLTLLPPPPSPLLDTPQKEQQTRVNHWCTFRLPNLSDVMFWRCARLCRCVFVYADVQLAVPEISAVKRSYFTTRRRREENLVDTSAKPHVCLTGESFQWNDVGSFENHIWISFFPSLLFNVGSSIIPDPRIIFQRCLR